MKRERDAASINKLVATVIPVATALLAMRSVRGICSERRRMSWCCSGRQVATKCADNTMLAAAVAAWLGVLQ
jgi:hypothetical protein